VDSQELATIVRRHQNVGALLKARAAEHPDRVFLKWDNHSVSYGQMVGDAAKVAGALSRLGIGKGDRVAIMMATSPKWLKVWFGAVMIGAIIVPINSAHLGDSLAYQLSDSEAAMLVIDAEFVHRLNAIDGPWTIDHTFVNGEVPDDLKVHVESLDVLLSGEALPPPTAQISFSDPATILYTSGTTGPPKGCVLPHGQYLAAAFLHAHNCGYSRDTVIYSCLPLFHINAQNYTVLSAVAAGAAIAMDQKFSASRFWTRMIETDATAFNFIGSMAVSLWNQPVRPEEKQHHARLAFGVPVPLDIWGEWEQRFGCKVVYAYGMTENALAAMFHHTDTPVPANLRGAAGRPSLTTEIRIVDDYDNSVPPGVVGEILSRPTIPATMMTEYWRKERATIEAFRSCWFHTGDLGYLDAAGYLFYADRKKDALRRKGEMVSSWEVETSVAKHPAVAECAVIGVPSEMGEDEIMAVVVLNDDAGEAFDPGELVVFCADRMPKFQIPRYIRTVSALPRTQTQRVEKFRLRREGITADTWDSATSTTHA
jgi:carnitine-CoA ligase